MKSLYLFILMVTICLTNGQSTIGPSKNASNNQQEKSANPEGQEGNKGYTQSRVFEYSLETLHNSKNPKVGGLGGNSDSLASSSSSKINPSSLFDEHEMARQNLPRFFTYDSELNNDNLFGSAATSNENTNESRKVLGYTPKTSIDSQFTQLGTEKSFVEKMVPESSYKFNYSPPPMPSFMSKISFSDEEDGDDFLESSSGKQQASTNTKINTNLSTRTDPNDAGKLRIIKNVMGSENHAGKPWGTRTTTVYRDPKSPDNYMEVTEIQMSMNSKNDDPQKKQDKVNRVVKSTRSNYKTSSKQQQPTYSSGKDSFFDDSFEPDEPIF